MLGEIQRDVDDHVFLTTHHAPATQLGEDFKGRDAVLGRGAFGMTQEAGVDPGVAQRQRFAVDAHRTILQRTHQIVGGRHELLQIAAMFPAQTVEHGDEHFQRGIAGACAHTGERGIHPVRAVFDRDDGVGHTQRQVVMAMNTDLGFWLQRVAHELGFFSHFMHQQGATRVGDIDAGRAIGFHQLGLTRQFGGGNHVRHHQKAHRVHAQLARMFDVLLGDIGFGAMGGDTHHARTGAIRLFQIMHGADAGNQQCGHLGMLDRLGHSLDPFEVGLQTEAIVEARSGQSVAMRDFDTVDLGLIQRLGNCGDLLDGVLMAARMHAVAQRDIRDVDFLGGFHVFTPCC